VVAVHVGATTLLVAPVLYRIAAPEVEVAICINTGAVDVAAAVMTGVATTVELAVGVGVDVGVGVGDPVGVGVGVTL